MLNSTSSQISFDDLRPVIKAMSDESGLQEKEFWSVNIVPVLNTATLVWTAKSELLRKIARDVL